jgi:hypothetical protein
MLETNQAAQLEKLTTIREQIAGWKAARDDIESAPLPAKTIVDQKLAQIDQVLDILCHPEHELTKVNFAHDVALLFIATFRDQLGKNITAHLQKTAGANALSPEEKLAKLAEVDSEILELERQEERLCVSLETGGVEVIRRGDLNPAAFFEVGPEAGDTACQTSES